MQVFPSGRDYVLRLDPGEEVVASLRHFLDSVDLPLAEISGLGAVDHCEVGAYNATRKRFEYQAFSGLFEITSLTGSVSRLQGKPYLHLHMTFADEDLLVRGGHLVSARISFTGELLVRRVEGRLERKVDPQLGINILTEA